MMERNVVEISPPLCSSVAFLQSDLLKDNGRWTAAEIAKVCENGIGLAVQGPQKDILGYILGKCVLEESEILSFGVHEKWRRQGIGTSLLTSFKKKAVIKGIKEIFLEVSENNKSAYYLYSSLNFFNVGKRKKYYESIENKFFDAIVMRCIL